MSAAGEGTASTDSVRSNDGALSFSEAWALVRRALSLAREESAGFAVKIVFSLVSLLPVFVLAWPLKIMVDTVILGMPIDENPTPYPFFIQPLVDSLAGRSPLEIVVWVTFVGLSMIFLVGGFGMQAATRDEIGDPLNNLAQGQDAATRSENQANYATSKVGGLLGLAEYWWTLRLSHRVNHRLRSRLFAHIQKLPMSTFDDERIGDAVFRVMYDTPAVTKLCYDVLIDPIRGPLQILIVVWLLDTSYFAAPEFSLIALSALPLSLLASLAFLKPMRDRAEVGRMAGSDTTSTMEESMSNVLAVQSLGGLDKEVKRFAQRSSESYAAFRSYMLVVFGAYGSGVALSVIVLGYVMWHTTNLIVEGRFTAGDFGVLLILYIQLFSGAQQVAFVWLRQQDNIAGLRRVFAVMDMRPENDHPNDGTPVGSIGEIRFEGVCFDYPDGTHALRGIDLLARTGEVVAIAGATGAGKTTLASMIPLFHRPTGGRIMIDGVDASELDLASLRDQVSFVFQETILFDGSVEENIRVARPGASAQEVARAARIARADDFIEALPRGYDTHLGVAGGKLSVGQKQRLSIARGLVRDPSVLILDEPTSALDPETEHALIHTLAAAAESRIVFIIAHRLSTIRASNQILFMEEGRIIESGRHEELMSLEGGAYRRFVELQTVGDMPSRARA